MFCLFSWARLDHSRTPEWLLSFYPDAFFPCQNSQTPAPSLAIYKSHSREGLGCLRFMVALTLVIQCITTSAQVAMAPYSSMASVSIWTPGGRLPSFSIFSSRIISCRLSAFLIISFSRAFSFSVSFIRDSRVGSWS